MSIKSKEFEYSYYKLGLTVFLSGVALICFFLAKKIIGIFLLTGILAVAIHPIVVWAERKKLSALIAISVLYLIFGLVFILVIAQLVPVAVGRLSELLEELPKAVETIESGVISLAQEANVNILIKEQLTGYIADASRLVASNVVSLTRNMFSLIGTLLFVLIVSGVLALDSKNIRKGFTSFFPKKSTGDINKKIDLFYLAVKKAFYGKIIVSAILGITILIGLWVLNVERFLALGLLAFILDFIPFVGSIIAGIIGIIFGFSKSVFVGILITILYLGANLIEVNITTPFFIGKEANIHPVLVLLSIGIGASVWGLLGIIISIPLAAGILAITKTDE